MHIAFFGSSLVSAYWNGAATYYRGVIRALHGRGHKITFYEPDAYCRQEHRDIADPPWARVVVYQATEQAAIRAARESRKADLIVKASGVGAFDDLLQQEVLDQRNASNLVVFWDVDAPATLDRLAQDPGDPFISLIPQYDAIFTYGGGEPVIRAYLALGARECIPIYNALDPSTHYPVPRERRFEGDLGFLGNRLPDREDRVERFFLEPARQLPDLSFLMGGAGWADKPFPPNIKYFDHIYTRDHNAFNVSLRAVLNISRESMARYGFSPATRIFEAAGAAACVITDDWEGVEVFFEPGKEILVASDGEEVVEWMRVLSAARAKEIGSAAYKRVLAEHTYAHRAVQIDSALDLSTIETEGAPQ